MTGTDGLGNTVHYRRIPFSDKQKKAMGDAMERGRQAARTETAEDRSYRNGFLAGVAAGWATA